MSESRGGSSSMPVSLLVLSVVELVSVALGSVPVVASEVDIEVSVVVLESVAPVPSSTELSEVSALVMVAVAPDAPELITELSSFPSPSLPQAVSPMTKGNTSIEIDTRVISTARV